MGLTIKVPEVPTKHGTASFAKILIQAPRNAMSEYDYKGTHVVPNTLAYAEPGHILVGYGYDPSGTKYARFWCVCPDTRCILWSYFCDNNWAKIACHEVCLVWDMGPLQRIAYCADQYLRLYIDTTRMDWLHKIVSRGGELWNGKIAVGYCNSRNWDTLDDEQKKECLRLARRDYHEAKEEYGERVKYYQDMVRDLGMGKERDQVTSARDALRRLTDEERNKLFREFTLIK